MKEHNFGRETGRFDQDIYDQVFMAVAKALITDSSSEIVVHPHEVPSDKEVVASEFIRPLTPEQVASLADGRYVMSADLRYVTPTKRLEDERHELSEVAITLKTFADGIVQDQSYAIGLKEDLDSGLGWYEASVVTEFTRGDEYVSYSGITPIESLSGLTDEDYLDEVSRLVADRMQGHRMMTDDELAAFATVIDGYLQSRSSLE